MIVFAIGVLLNRPAVELGGLVLTPAWLLFVATAVWYLSRGSLVLGPRSARHRVLTLLAHRVGGGSGTGSAGASAS